MNITIDITGIDKEEAAAELAADLLRKMNWVEVLGPEVSEKSPFKNPVEQVWVTRRTVP